MIDRLVHHAEILALKGDSYRLKDRDLTRPADPRRMTARGERRSGSPYGLASATLAATPPRGSLFNRRHGVNFQAALTVRTYRASESHPKAVGAARDDHAVAVQPDPVLDHRLRPPRAGRSATALLFQLVDASSSSTTVGQHGPETGLEPRRREDAPCSTPLTSGRALGGEPFRRTQPADAGQRGGSRAAGDRGQPWPEASRS